MPKRTKKTTRANRHPAKTTRVRPAKSATKKTAAKRSPGTTVTETVSRKALSSFPVAMTAVIAGHAVRRLAWVKGGQADSVVLRSFGLGWRELDSVRVELDRDDILATDWEIA